MSKLELVKEKTLELLSGNPDGDCKIRGDHEYIEMVGHSVGVYYFPEYGFSFKGPGESTKSIDEAAEIFARNIVAEKKRVKEIMSNIKIVEND